MAISIFRTLSSVVFNNVSAHSAAMLVLGRRAVQSIRAGVQANQPNTVGQHHMKHITTTEYYLCLY